MKDEILGDVCYNHLDPYLNSTTTLFDQWQDQDTVAMAATCV